MIRQVHKNLLDADEKVIVQQVNHRGVMGAGLALQLKKKYPKMLEGYVEVCKKWSWEYCKEFGLVYFYDAPDGKKVANLFGQDTYGWNAALTDYLAVENGMKTINRYCFDNGVSVAIPFGMGCGLGGGDWNRVLQIILDTHSEYENDFDIVIHKL